MSLETTEPFSFQEIIPMTQLAIIPFSIGHIVITLAS